MGVKGLWKLLLPIGRRISIETLAGKILAIDASIWLTQFVKAMRNAETGRTLPSAHLIGFFRRLCRLRYHGIRPVFVFDGATPEMKRREILLRRRRRDQFANKLGDAGFQRLAKKLLVETLKKQKSLLSTTSKTTATALTSAFAPGFNPGTQDDDRKPPPADDNKSQSSAQSSAEEEREEKKDEAPLLPIPAAEAVAPAVAAEPNDSDDENDWKDSVTYPSSTAAPAPAAPDNSKDDDASSSSSSREDLEYVREDGLDIDLIANLPASKRKDAIEQAQRRLRLESRRQFMPAAANPLQFSQVQVSTFLKSAKLNKDIVRAAQQAANRDNLHDAMASDLTTRVELIRENDNTHDSAKSNSQCRSKLKSSSVVQANHRRLVRRTAVGDMVEEEEDDDDDDEDLFSEQTKQPSRVRAIQDDDDDDDSSLDDHPGKHSAIGSAAVVTGGGFVASNDKHPSQQLQASTTTTARFLAVKGVVVTDSSGGFVETIDLARESSDSSSSSEQEGLEGGFLKSDVMPLENGYGGGGFIAVSPNNRDSAASTTHAARGEDIHHACDLNGLRETAAQDQDETTDYALAVALQEAEDEGLALLLESGNGNLERETRNNDYHRRIEEQVLAVGTRQRQNSVHAAAAKGDESNTELDDDEEADDSVAWEEGEDATSDGDRSNTYCMNGVAAHASTSELAGARKNEEDIEAYAGNLIRKTNNLAGNEVKGSKARWNSSLAPQQAHLIDLTLSESTTVAGSDKSRTHVRGDFSQATLLQKTEDIAVARQLIPRDQMERTSENKTEITIDDENDSDEVEWEEGADAVQDPGCLAGIMRAPEADGKTGDLHQEQLDWYNGRDAPCGQAKVSAGAAFGSDDSDDNWDSQPRAPAIDETAAALERGLATASNLTNWAGAAFRRAMESAGQGGSKSASSNPPTACSTPNNRAALDDDHAEGITFVNSTTPPSASKYLGGTDINDKDRSEMSPPRVRQDNPANPTGPSNTAFQINALELDIDQDSQWAEERNKRERDMDTVTDEMREEAIQLLQLFGVPFVEAPAEAEAQCATLEELGLVHGIVTEDSDVFVFGGKTVYKNIFEEQKYTEVYKAEDAAREMSLGRNQMVALAMLLGGDYTAGVNGVGIVNAMEILETFDTSLGVKSGLSQFKRWLEGIDQLDAASEFAGNVKVLAFHENHKTARTRWTMPEGFPAENVLQAYLNPVVERSEERFSWGLPDVEKLVLFCQRNIGWSPEETTKLLNPVMDQLRNSFRQTRIDSYMKYEDSITFADVRSKRLRDVLGLSSVGGGDSKASPQNLEQKSRTRRIKRHKK